ncbi:MAG: GIY-YIG nuclease family protein [Deferribacterales bacterium]
MKKGYVYILTCFNRNVLYVGVTSDLIKRIYQHKNKMVDGFAKRYNLDMLVWYECFETITDAIAREKQIKGGSRAKKIALVNSFNPDWNDLYDQVIK